MCWVTPTVLYAVDTSNKTKKSPYLSEGYILVGCEWYYLKTIQCTPSGLISSPTYFPTETECPDHTGAFWSFWLSVSLIMKPVSWWCQFIAYHHNRIIPEGHHQMKSSFRNCYTENQFYTEIKVRNEMSRLTWKILTLLSQWRSFLPMEKKEKKEFCFPGESLWKSSRSFFVNPGKNSQCPAGSRSESRDMPHFTFSQDPEPSDLGPLQWCLQLVSQGDSPRELLDLRDSHFLNEHLASSLQEGSGRTRGPAPPLLCTVSLYKERHAFCTLLGLGPTWWHLKVTRKKNVSRESKEVSPP